MLLLITFLPLVNFLLFPLFARFVATQVLARYVYVSMGALLGGLIALLPAIAQGEVYWARLGVWISSGLFDVGWNFLVDPLTYAMLIVVLTVSTLVHLYSTEYMSEDPHLARFISYLSLFTFFMLLLITADNLIGLFLGWEGVGLCSFVLISFWFTRIQANKSAIKAMVVNRIADLAFTVGIAAAFYTFQTVDFAPMFGVAPFYANTSLLFGALYVSPVGLVTFLLFLGAMGKSAQIGLHTWLPDAMEGPTPVSALIHAATMVTAGVFLILRTSPLFELASTVLLFVALVGAATAFMAATSGLFQSDVKKVIAYSTCSQLGYMVFACGLSSYTVSLFHLSNHAFFKALLFLSAGALIHSVSNEQDLRRFGGLLGVLPYTYIMFVVGSIALMGFPFLTGFYSKDLILEIGASTVTLAGTFAYWIGLLTAVLTAFYSIRLLYLAFFGQGRSPRPYLLAVHELTPRMGLSLAVLALGSLFLGYLSRDLFVGFGSLFWNGAVVQHPTYGATTQFGGELLSPWVKFLPLFGSVAATSVVFVLQQPLAYASALPSFSGRTVFRFLSHKWYFDLVYNRFVNQPLLIHAYNLTFSLIDKGLLEEFGPRGAGVLLNRAGRILASAQTGRVFDYAFSLLAALFFFLVWVV